MHIVELHQHDPKIVMRVNIVLVRIDSGLPVSDRRSRFVFAQDKRNASVFAGVIGPDANRRLRMGDCFS